MSGNSRKMSRQIKEQLAQSRRIANEEKDTIYWLVFVPKPAFIQPGDLQNDRWSSRWRERLMSNPDKRPELIDEAIRSFEMKNNIKSWREIAVSHHIDGLYFP